MIWSDALRFVVTAVIFCMQIQSEGHGAEDERGEEEQKASGVKKSFRKLGHSCERSSENSQAD